MSHNMSTSAKNVLCKPDKWTIEQIEVLIDTYKGEACLYATTLSSYHNKYLRSKALARVHEAVVKLRSSVTIKECVAKFHNLRSQFNIEHSKIRASHKSGTGTDNIHKPSLWYYDKMLFLASYVQPHKSKSSWKPDEMADREVTSEPNPDTAVNSQNSELLLKDNSGTVDDELLALALQEELEVDTEQGDFSFSQLDPLPSTSATPGYNTSSTSETSTTRTARKTSTALKRKRRDSCDESYIAAIREVANSIKHPITLVDKRNTATSSCDPVDPFVNFIGSLLRTFENNGLKLEIMNNITNMVIKGKTRDSKKD